MTNRNDYSVCSTRSSDGARLAYLDGGDRSARPLVLVHGWAQSGRCWGAELLARLGETFHVVAVDLRGHGNSEITDGGYDSSTQWADDLAAVLAAAGIGDGDGAILLGWSYGGIVVADYLSRRGEAAVAGIVLCGAVTSIGRSATGRVGPAMTKVTEGAFEDDPRTAIAALSSFGTAMMRGEDGPGRQRLFGLSLATPPRVRRKLLTRRVDNDDTLRGLTIPALVVHGADDGVVLPEAGRANAELVPRGRYVEFPDCAHAPFLERPEEFVSALGGFAAELDGR